jgi:hypothetical protein
MVRKFASHKFLSLTAILCFPLLITYFFFTPVVSSREMRLTQDLARHFVQHQLLTLDATSMAAQVRQTGRMSLATPDLSFDLELVPHDIRTAGYRAEEFGSNGVARPLDPGPVRTFKGLAHGTEQGARLPQVGQARFTIDDSGVEGLIITPSKHYFVEPARKYSKEAKAADYVIYKESDVLTSSGAHCGVTLSETVAQKAAEIGPPSEQQVTTANAPHPQPTLKIKDDRFKRSSAAIERKTHRHHSRITRNVEPAFPDCGTQPLFNRPVIGNLQGDCVAHGRWVDIYRFSGTAGQQIIISMSSSVFNAYLYVLAPNGDLLLEDDDGGLGTNARIPARGGMLSLPVDGTYKVYATSHSANETGDYSILLSALNPLPTPDPVQELRVATEADNEYVVSKGGSAAASQAILSILNQVEGLYEVELGLTVRVVYQSTWSTPNDPYSSTNASELLGELSNHWNANRGSVARDVVHMWTGKQLDNSTIGTAYLEALCRFTGGGRAAYGLSKGVPGAQQVAITAHELGHNLGATHPNQQVPSVTECDNTVMSSSVSTSSTLTMCQFSRDEIAKYLETSVGCISAGTRLLRFATASTFLAGMHPQSVTGADFNGDGKGDVAVANSISNDVSVFFGTDSGNLQPSINHVVGSGPVSVAVGDFNGDGKQDLVTANSESNNVSVLLATGTGAFQSATSFSAGVFPNAVAVGDFNNDAKHDLAVVNQGNISILLGTGTGSFQAAVNFPIANPSSVAVADFNGDGNQDLAVPAGNTLALLLGTGTGSFQSPVNFPIFTPDRSVAVGDFNGDGKQDVATTGRKDDFSGGALLGVTVLLGTGTGSFETAVHYPAPGPSSVTVGDFNGDGKQDLATANDRDDSASVLLGTGTGSFQSAVTYAVGGEASSVAVVDINGDGLEDLVTANSRSNNVSVLLGNGDGSFPRSESFPVGAPPTAIAIGDFNRDGFQDVVTANSSSDFIPEHVSVLLGTGTGSLHAAEKYPTPQMFPRSVVVGDFNSDGKLDFAVGGGPNVRVFFGMGTGSFQSVVSFPISSGFTSMVGGDFNGDGKQDLAIAHSNFLGDDSVGVLLGSEASGFSTEVNFGVGLDPTSVVAGDFNGDGKQDLATCNRGSTDVSVLLGTGTGSFQPPSNFALGFPPNEIALGDFNGDGKQDLAVTNNVNVSVLLGTGTGSFQSAVDSADGGGGLAVADFNGDGKEDLVIGQGGFRPGISLLLGTSSASFQNGGNYLSGPLSRSIAVGDLNQDGKPDLVVGNILPATDNAEGAVRVLLNTSGNFARGPLNDNFATSRAISGPIGSLGGSTLVATVESGEPNHAINSNGSGGASIWYRWKAPSTGRFYFQTFSSSFATVLVVYTGSSVNALTRVATSTSSVAEYVEFDATAGTTYQIAIDGVTGDTGRTVLNWNTGSLSNDNFAFAREIRGTSGSVNGNNTNFTIEPNEPPLPGATGDAFSAWYRWTAPNTGIVSFSTTPCGDTRRLLGTYTGNFLDILVPVAVNFDGYRDVDDPGICDNRTLRFNAVAGTSYRIQMRSVGGAPFTLHWNYADPPPNDNFANALILAGVAGSVAGTNRDATKEFGESNHAGGAGGASVWYRWTAPVSGEVTFDTIGFRSQSPNSFRYLTALMAVYTGTNLNALTEVVKNATENKVTFTATAGTTYQIAVDSGPYTGGGFLPGIIPLHWGTKQVANDDFVNAQALAATGSFSPLLGSNAGATKEADEPNHQGSVGGTSVWYRWTALSNGDASFVFNTCATCSLTASNARVAVYTGSSVNALTAVPTSLDNNHTFAGIRGRTYFIAVDSATGAGGTYEFSLVSSQISARNDAYGNAQLLTGSAGAVAGDNSGATKEIGEPNHANDRGGASVWYQWTAPVSGLVTFDTFGSNFDTLLGVYTGNVVSVLSTVAGSDNAGVSTQSRVTFDAKLNTTYYIVVDGKSIGLEPGTGLPRSQSGFIQLNWSNLPPPVNDHFGDSQLLTGMSGSATGRNTVASKEGGEPNHVGNPGGVSIWYQWTAPETAKVTFNTFGSDFNTLVGLYTGTSVNSLTSVSTNDDVGGLTQSRVTFNALAGTTYRIAVDGSVGVPGSVTPFTGNLVLSWFPELDGGNDNFAQAQTLSGNSGSVAGTNAGATKESGEPQHAGDSGGRSLWHSWTAPFSGPVLLTTSGSDFDTLLAVYTGASVNALTLVAANDDSSHPDNLGHILTSSLTFTATAGTTYKIAVDGSGGRFGNFALRWGPEAKISGQVLFLSGVCGSDKKVSLLLSGEDTRAVSFTGSGTYTFEHLRVGGNYSVRAVSEISANCLPLFLERARSFFPLAGDVFDANFIDDGLRGGGSTSNITGHITATGGLGLGNVAIALSGTASRTVYSDSAGLYLLPNLPAGTYQVTPSRVGAVFSPARREFTFTSGQTITDADFATQDSFNISGQTRAQNGASLSGVTITLNNGSQPVTVQTDGNGYYAFDAMAGNSYTLTAAKAGLSFTPASKSINGLSANQKNVDFTVTQTHTLTIASANPSSGLTITVSPNDNNSQGSGATQFTRTYALNTNVTLTAPAVVGSNNFLKWQKDGADYSTELSTSVTLDADHTMTAVFLTTSAQTPAGENVAVQLNGVKVTFLSVTAAGTTTITPINPAAAGQLPNGYQLTGNSIAFDISTTATVQPPISVCFHVPAVTDAQGFAQLRILHNENGTLVDRTSRQDFETKMICTSVNSLSSFVLASTTIPLLQLVLEESTSANHAAALDSVLFLRDPFPVINQQNLLKPGPDRNTRVLVFVKNLQLAANETATAVVVNLVDSANQSFDIAAENVWVAPNTDFSQISFRLPDTLAPGTCTIQIRVHGQVSNSAFIQIRTVN